MLTNRDCSLNFFIIYFGEKDIMQKWIYEHPVYMHYMILDQDFACRFDIHEVENGTNVLFLVVYSESFKKFCF